VEVVCVSHGLRGPSVRVGCFVSFVWGIRASLLTCRQLSYRRMNVRVGRGGCWDHLGSWTLEEKEKYIHLVAASNHPLPRTGEKL
jgi:hypothetical protein